MKSGAAASCCPWSPPFAELLSRGAPVRVLPGAPPALASSHHDALENGTCWLPAHRADPRLFALLDHLDIRIPAVGKQVPMLVRAQKSHAGSTGMFFRKTRQDGAGAFVDFRRDHKQSTWLQNPLDFPDVARQVWPPEVCFHSRDQIERVVGKRQLGDGRKPNFYSTDGYPAGIGSRG